MVFVDLVGVCMGDSYGGSWWWYCDLVGGGIVMWLVVVIAYSTSF